MPEINIKPCPFCGEEAKTNVSAGIPEENLPFGWGLGGLSKMPLLYKLQSRGARFERGGRRVEQES